MEKDGGMIANAMRQFRTLLIVCALLLAIIYALGMMSSTYMPVWVGAWRPITEHRLHRWASLRRWNSGLWR